MTNKLAKPERAGVEHGMRGAGLLDRVIAGFLPVFALSVLVAQSSCAAASRELIYAENEFSAGRYRCVVVAPFENQSHTEGAGFAVADFMAGALGQTQRFKVVDRKEVQLFLDKPSNADYKMDPGQAVDLGKRLRADAVVIGAVNDYWYRTADGKPEIALTMRVIDVRTETVVYVANASYRAQFFSKRPFLLTAAAQQVADASIAPITLDIPMRRLDDLQCGLPGPKPVVAAVAPVPEKTIEIVEPAPMPGMTAEPVVTPEPTTAQVEPAVVAAVPPEPVLTPSVLVLLRRMNMTKNFVLDGITFELDKTSFKDDAYRDTMKNLGLALAARPGLKIRLDVHTDGLGDAEFNQKLTEARARLLKEILVREYNIDAARIEAAGSGGDRPLLPNINRKNREANRRVELNVLQGP